MSNEIFGKCFVQPDLESRERLNEILYGEAHLRPAVRDMKTGYDQVATSLGNLIICSILYEYDTLLGVKKTLIESSVELEEGKNATVVRTGTFFPILETYEGRKRAKLIYSWNPQYKELTNKLYVAKQEADEILRNKR